MKSFLCPTGTNCGPSRIIVKPDSLTYSLDTITMIETENLCMHELVFPLDAGLNDIIHFKIRNTVYGTKMKFAVGKSFEDHRGFTEFLEDKDLS